MINIKVDEMVAVFLFAFFQMHNDDDWMRRDGLYVKGTHTNDAIFCPQHIQFQSNSNPIPIQSESTPHPHPDIFQGCSEHWPPYNASQSTLRSNLKVYDLIISLNITAPLCSSVFLHFTVQPETTCCWCFPNPGLKIEVIETFQWQALICGTVYHST